MKIKCKCKNCNKEFETYHHRINNGRWLYCNKKCYHEYKKNNGLTNSQKKKLELLQNKQ